MTGAAGRGYRWCGFVALGRSCVLGLIGEWAVASSVQQALTSWFGVRVVRVRVGDFLGGPLGLLIWLGWVVGLFCGTGVSFVGLAVRPGAGGLVPGLG